MRILLIEDEPEMASVLKTALERRDVVVDHVSTLADAEAMAKFGPFDACVDTSGNASDFFHFGDEQCGRVPSCVRPHHAAFNAAGPYGSFGDRIQIG
jgi:hypothetical protein